MTPMFPKSVAYGRKLKVYPLSQIANPPPTVRGLMGFRESLQESLARGHLVET